ncbi:MAG: hypothetical protein KME57_11960 [Scytonema hyalinum WJT4-NPBG1]|nr:hypothetical protein [Scytonema hyalinum WJT4-NPBG1]
MNKNRVLRNKTTDGHRWTQMNTNDLSACICVPYGKPSSGVYISGSKY